MKKRGVIFVGGGHGVGKSTLCQLAAARLMVSHRSAGSLIKRMDPAAVSEATKHVQDMDANQRLLVAAVQDLCTLEGQILLDGHYAVAVRSVGIRPIPAAVFQALNICALAHIGGDADLIHAQLLSRDGVDALSIQEVRTLLSIDHSHAHAIAHALGLPLAEFQAADQLSFLHWVQAQLSPTKN